MKIVADSLPLINLALLGKLELLDQMFDEILVPRAVYDEIAASNVPHWKTIKTFIKHRVETVSNAIAIKLLRTEIDLGEAETIVLAMDKEIPYILIDDSRGRVSAHAKGLKPIGTIGILLAAKRRNLLEHVKPLFKELERNKRNIGKKLYRKAMEYSQER